MARMTAGRALVRSLIKHGVDTVFGVPGIQLDHLFNALHDERNAVRVIHTRHEQAAAYMAFGYARAGNRVGTYAVVPGPGILNTTAALATAYGCNTPVLALTGEIPSHAIGQGYGLLHEIPDQIALLRGLTKHTARIDHPSQVASRVAEAFRHLRTELPRPVGIETPLDVLALETELDLPDAAPVPPPLAADPALIDEAVALLGKAERPVIVVGGGAQDAGSEVLALAEMLEAPVISHRMGRGVVSDRHYLSVTQPVGHRLWADADAVLAIGTRLQQHRMIWGKADLRTVRIDIEPTQMYRLGRPDVAIVADAGAACASLAAALRDSNRQRPSREAELAAVKAEVRAEMETKLAPQIGFIDALRRALPDDGILVDELTQVGYVARAAFPIWSPRTLISSGYQGTLGSGFPTALGVKVACPDRSVLSINGDGGFMFNVQELSTAVQQALTVVTVVFDDGAYGNVKRMQENLHGGRVIATELRNPDFVKLAESFGAAGERVENPADLEAAVMRGWERTGPTLIAVKVDKMPDPWGVSQPVSNVRPG